MSKNLNENRQLEKWYAVSYNNKISYIGKGIITQSLRDSGKALDLQVISLLYGVKEKIELEKVRIFEIRDERNLDELKLQY